MKDFHLRTDLERVYIGDFALPLGLAPAPGRLQAPEQGYTVAFVPGEDDEPDTYTFHVVVSYERLAPILHRAFELLPDEVYAIVEIGSRDAYRSTDTYISEDAISLDEFLDTWKQYQPFLLEDGSIAAGANSEEPFVEVFIDQWKGIAIHVPTDRREEVEEMLRTCNLEEVVQTWPDMEADESLLDEENEESSQIRSVLDTRDENAPDVDELLLDLRHDWKLELNIDKDSNIDEGGRDLGSTLWHAVVIVDSTADSPTANGELDKGGYASIWATAASLGDMEQMIERALEEHPQWAFGEIYTIDRVAFDERPDELGDLHPGRREPQVHLVTIEPWTASPTGEGDEEVKT